MQKNNITSVFGVAVLCITVYLQCRSCCSSFLMFTWLPFPSMDKPCHLCSIYPWNLEQIHYWINCLIHVNSDSRTQWHFDYKMYSVQTKPAESIENQNQKQWTSLCSFLVIRPTFAQMCLLVVKMYQYRAVMLANWGSKKMMPMKLIIYETDITSQMLDSIVVHFAYACIMQNVVVEIKQAQSTAHQQ